MIRASRPPGTRITRGSRLASHGLRNALEQSAEPTGTLTGFGRTPDQQHSGSVCNQIRSHRTQRSHIGQPLCRFDRDGNHQGLPTERIEIETLLPETIPLTRTNLSFRHYAHRSRSSYHNRHGAATTWFAELFGARLGSRSRRGHTPHRLWLLWLALTLFTWRPEVAASSGFLAGEHQLAVAAGNEVLRQGGNAVDAAVAATATLGVVNPISCGLGGGGFMLIYDATTGEVHALDFRESAPAQATPARFLQRGVKRITRGPVSVAVPGEPAGLTAAHERFGSLPLAVVIAPAIRYASDGFPIEAHLAEGIVTRRELLHADPALADVFLHPDGTPRLRGEYLRQPDLAKSLARLAAEGSAPFYRGEIARSIAATVTRRGGFLTAAGSGNVQRSMEGSAARTIPRADSLHHAAARLRWGAPHSTQRTLSLRTRVAGVGIPNLSAPPGRHDEGSVRRQGPLLRRSRVRRRSRSAPDFPTHTPMPSASASRQYVCSIVIEAGSADAGTSHISVVDALGNAVALTTTINTAFGSGMVAPRHGDHTQQSNGRFQPGAGSCQCVWTGRNSSKCSCSEQSARSVA